MKPCCDRRTMVAMIAMLDMAFGIMLSCISAHSLLSGQNADGPHPSMRLLHLFPSLIINTFQTLVAFHLLMSVVQIDPTIIMLKTSIWNHGAYLTLSCLTVKFFALLLLVFNDGYPTTTVIPFWRGYANIVFLMVLAVLEMVFKTGSILLISGYLEELRVEAYRIPNVRFYSTCGPPQPSMPPASSISSTLPPPPPSGPTFDLNPRIVPTHSFAEKKLGSESIYITNFPSYRTRV